MESFVDDHFSIYFFGEIQIKLKLKMANWPEGKNIFLSNQVFFKQNKKVRNKLEKGGKLIYAYLPRRVLQGDHRIFPCPEM